MTYKETSPVNNRVRPVLSITQLYHGFPCYLELSGIGRHHDQFPFGREARVLHDEAAEG